jgi:hypothetical protein
MAMPSAVRSPTPPANRPWDCRPPSKQATIGLPTIGDNAGSDAADTTLPAMVLQLLMEIALVFISVKSSAG